MHYVHKPISRWKGRDPRGSPGGGCPGVRGTAAEGSGGRGGAAGLRALHTTPDGHSEGEGEGWSLFSPSDWTDGVQAAGSCR